MKRLLISILLVALLLVGCTSNGAKVEELQSEIAELQRHITQLEQQLAELEAQVAEKDARQDKNEAIGEFALEALELQRVFMNVAAKWTAWQQQSLLEMSPDNYPRYKTHSKEEEAILKGEELSHEVRNAITSIELLYAPPEALETKGRLLAEGDSLSHALGDIMNYYLAPDTHPPTLYEEALDFIFFGLGEIDKDIRRELTDLALEYGQ